MRAITTIVAASLLSFTSAALGQGNTRPAPGGTAPPASTPAPTGQNAGAAWQWKEFALRDRRTISYAVILPKDYKAGDSYPVLMVMPPGSQSRESVEQMIPKYWSTGGERGWVVVCPVSPDRRPLHAGNAAAVDELFDFVLREYKPVGGKMHLAGVDVGGRTAWAAILEHPDKFASLTVLPGLPPETSPRKVAALKGTPIVMFAGERDATTVRNAQRAVERFKREGVDVTLNIEPAQGIVIESLTSTRLFDLLDQYRSGRAPGSTASAPDAGLTPAVVASAIGRTLDDFHDAAAKADEKRYFDHAAPEFVFIGTDATERWSLEQFRTFASPYFTRGKAWTYIPVQGKRSVVLSPDGNTAFFDEILQHDRFGTCRGTGAMRKVGAGWKISQYSLSVPIPNPKMDSVVDVIKK